MGEENKEKPTFKSDFIADSVLTAKAKKLALRIKRLQRPTFAWVDDMRNAVSECGDFAFLPDGQVKPSDPELNTWIAPFNKMVLEEPSMPNRGDEGFKAAWKKFKQDFLALTLEMAEGDWISHCGLPKSNGLQIHMANAPQFKDTVGKMRTKFRNRFYGRIEDVGMEGQQDLYFEWFKKCAELTDEDIALGKLTPEQIEERNKEQWVIIGRHLIELGSTEGCSIKRKGKWRDEKRGKAVEIHNVITPTKTFVLKSIGEILREKRRFQVFVNTVKASKQYTLVQETRAMEKLKEMVTPEQYEQYCITGIIEETSAKSGVTYYVRKLKPTLAVRVSDGEQRFLCGLCMHPMAYYLDSFAGCLCPTDDVMAHLLWIRGDERRFWSKANHHPQEQVEVGLP